MNLSDAKVLVTGGTGLIGSHIVDELVKEGARVIVYDSLIRGKIEHLDWARAHGEVQIVKADIRDREALRRTMSGVDYVFHQSASWLCLCQNDPRLSL